MSDIVSVNQFSKYQNHSNVAGIDEEKTKKVLNRLFTRFENIFPKFWVNIKSQEHLNGIKDEWFECFQRAKLTDAHKIKIGISRAQESHLEYLPKASVFIDWCTNIEPESLGFPSHLIAYDHFLLINSQFSDHKHPDERVDKIIRHVIRQIGAFNIRSMSDKDSRKSFETYYSIAVRDFIIANLKDIDDMIEDNTQVTQEIKKKEGVVLEQYKNLTKDSALAAIKQKLK